MEIEILHKNEERATIEITFKSGKKVKMNIDDKRNFKWIQMFFYCPVIPNPQTFGKIAKRLYIKKQETTVAFNIGNKDIQII